MENGSDQEVALPLMCALLTRVPLQQRGQVFHGRLWQQLSQLIGAQSASSQDLKARYRSAALAAILCQSPEAASSFFEAGGFSAILSPEMVRCRMRLAPTGLHALDAAHPACLVAILQVLVSVLGVLPTTLVLQSTLQWLERHAQSVLDILQWITRLPMVLSTEPRGAQASSLATMVSDLASRSGGRAGTGPDAMLLYCNLQASGSLEDPSVDGLAPPLSGRHPLSDATFAEPRQ